jgi:hypothetical protein
MKYYTVETDFEDDTVGHLEGMNASELQIIVSNLNLLKPWTQMRIIPQD